MNKLIPIAVTLALAACGGGVTPPAPHVTVPPPDIKAPPPPPVVDDTAAVQALLDAGGVVQLDARTYHISRTLMMSHSGTTLQGHGASTVLFYEPPAPGTVKHCQNDRVITTRCALSATIPLEVAGAINVGDTSFQAANSSDLAGIGAGDWLLITNWDPGIKDGTFHTSYATTVDWVQVANVSGTTVNVTVPFRQAFSTPFPYTPSTGGTITSGVGFQKIFVTQDLAVQDLSIVVDPSAAGSAVGVAILSTLNATVQRISVTTHGTADPLYSEYSKGATFANNTTTGAGLSEFATSVDLTLAGNTMSSTNSPAIGLDLGTAFFTVNGNRILASANAGIYALYNVHDGAISNNDLAYVDTVNGATRAIGILLEGCPYVSVTGNSLAGGAGATSVGILFSAYAAAQLPEPDTGDTASGNSIQGFATQQVGP